METLTKRRFSRLHQWQVNKNLMHNNTLVKYISLLQKNKFNRVMSFICMQLITGSKGIIQKLIESKREITCGDLNSSLTVTDKVKGLIFQIYKI